MEGKQTIDELAQGVIREMERLQYAPLTIRTFGWAARRLKKYVQEKTGDVFFSEEIGRAYLRDSFDYPPKESRPLTSKEGAGIRCVRRIGEYQLYGAICLSKNSEKNAWELDDQKLITAYVEAMQTADNSEQTKQTRRNHIKNFYDFMASRKLRGVRDVSAQTISDYAASLQGYSPVYNKHRLATLRNYFRFLYKSGFLETDWSDAVPRVVAVKNRTIPALWEKSEIERLLNGIDRGNPTGRRDYAIILLVAQLGLRISDISELCLGALKWERKEIEVIQHKTGKPVVHPLPENAGWALIDYIRYARPKIESPYVFLTANAPYGQMSPTAVGCVLARRMERCGIEKRPGTVSGMHSLRHALARRLLEDGTPLETVADIMGHTSYSSTSPYLKVDIEGLRECALSLEEAFADD